MEARASTRHARIAPQKARLVVDLIRGKRVEEAIGVLEFNPRRASKLIAKTLKSAIANAENNEAADVDDLRVAEIMVDEGFRLKRIKPRAKGRADRILKRTSHITVTVSDESQSLKRDVKKVAKRAAKK